MKTEISKVENLIKDWIINFNHPSTNYTLPYFANDLGQISNGELHVIGSDRTAKNSFMLTQAIYTALKQKESVLLFSLDLPKNELVRRIISQKSRIATSQISNTIELTSIQSFLNNKPLYIAENNCLNIFELQNTIHEFVKSNDIKLVIIDSLEIISTNPNNWKDKEILLILGTLKQIAIDLNIAILISTEDNFNGDKPSLKNIEYSSIIERFANRILLIYRPEYYAIQEFEDGSNAKGKADIMVIDNKQGVPHSVRLNFDNKCLLFY